MNYNLVYFMFPICISYSSNNQSTVQCIVQSQYDEVNFRPKFLTIYNPQFAREALLHCVRCESDLRFTFFLSHCIELWIVRDCALIIICMEQIMFGWLVETTITRPRRFDIKKGSRFMNEQWGIVSCANLNTAIFAKYFCRTYTLGKKRLLHPHWRQ